MDIHIKRSLLILADSVGNLWQIDLSSPSLRDNKGSVDVDIHHDHENYKVHKNHDDSISKRKAVPIKLAGVHKEMLNFQKVTIDWVNDVVYLLCTFGIGMFRFDHNPPPPDGYQFNWFITGIDTNRTANIHVDPIGNYLYWSTVGDHEDAGLYRTLLTSFEQTVYSKHKHQPKISRILTKDNLAVFTIDVSKQKLYFPENSTIFAMSLTGSAPYTKPDFTLIDVRAKDLRKGPFTNASYLVHFSDLFFWLTGNNIYHEEKIEDQITYNSVGFDVKLVSFLVVHPSLQPYPMSSLHQKSSIDVGAIQSVYRFNSAAFMWTCIGSLVLLGGFLILAKKGKC